MKAPTLFHFIKTGFLSIVCDILTLQKIVYSSSWNYFFAYDGLIAPPRCRKFIQCSYQRA